nr:DUF692 family multinuclear iron-containing protein [Dongshaea marina]
MAEIHLAGFSERELSDGTLLIDTHSRPVVEEVWQLYRELCHSAQRPTLIEWDLDIPELEVLLAEAAKASGILTEVTSDAA